MRATNLPSQPSSETSLPRQVACFPAPAAAAESSKVTARDADRDCAAASARASPPITSRLPRERYETEATGPGSGNCEIAARAAIFASAPSGREDQPRLSNETAGDTDCASGWVVGAPSLSMATVSWEENEVNVFDVQGPLPTAARALLLTVLVVKKFYTSSGEIPGV